MSAFSERMEPDKPQSAWASLVDQVMPRLWVMARDCCATGQTAAVLCQLVWLRLELAMRSDGVPDTPDEWLAEGLLEASTEGVLRVAIRGSGQETEHAGGES